MKDRDSLQDILLKLCAASAVFWAVSLAVAGLSLAALGLLAGRLEFWHTPAAFGLGLACAAAAARAAWSRAEAASARLPSAWRAPWLDGMLAALYFAAAFRAFFWVAFEDRGALRVENPNNLGDLSLHLAIIHHLAGPGRFWPESPILSGEPLAYPIGMDLVNAALVKAGLPWLPGLIATGFLGALAVWAALRLWGGWFVVAGFLFNGGLGALDLLAGQGPEIQWKSLFDTMLVPQRGFLFAFPAGLLLLADARARMRGAALLPARAALLILAALPLFHVHTAMFAGGLLVWWLVFARGFRRAAGAALAAAAVAWPPLLYLVTGGFAGKGLVRWAPGWMQGEEGLWFWLRNFGVLPLLALAALSAAVWARAGGRVPPGDDAVAARRFLLPAILCFLATCFISFAPWLWDNTKLMVWSCLAALPFIGLWLRQRVPAAAGAALAVLLFVSGAVSFFQRMTRPPAGYEIASRAELAEVAAMTGSLPGPGRFAAAPAYNHPLLLLGYPVAVGYAGHLWSHGYDYGGRLGHLTRLMRGEAGWRESAAALGVRYVFWGPREEREFSGSSMPWSGLGMLSSRAGFIYDLGPPDAPPEPAERPAR